MILPAAIVAFAAGMASGFTAGEGIPRDHRRFFSHTGLASPHRPGEVARGSRWGAL